MTEQTNRVLLVVARHVPAPVAERARRDFNAIVADEDWDVPTVIDLCRKHGNPAVLIGQKSGFQAADIEKLPETLRVIVNPSAGYDHLDVEAARKRGIIVTNAPDAMTDCTADLTFLLILGACRRASEYEAIMRAGWRKPFGLTDMLGKQVHGRTLGIVGMGRIGRAVARRAQGFDMTVLYHNRSRLPAELEMGAGYVADFKDLLPRADILSLNLPATGQTLMTRDAFALMKKGAVFVNAARGGLVDEDALIEALETGPLFAAGLDVFRNEPAMDMRFTRLPNVFMLPHMGSATEETRNRMGFTALDNAAAVIAGKPPLDPV